MRDYDGSAAEAASGNPASWRSSHTLRYIVVQATRGVLPTGRRWRRGWWRRSRCVARARGDERPGLESPPVGGPCIDVFVMATQEDRTGLPGLADINRHQILLTDGAVRRRLDHVIRDEMACIPRAVRRRCGKLGQVLASLGPRLPEHGVGREQVGIRG